MGSRGSSCMLSLAVASVARVWCYRSKSVREMQRRRVRAGFRGHSFNRVPRDQIFPGQRVFQRPNFITRVRACECFWSNASGSETPLIETCVQLFVFVHV